MEQVQDPIRARCRRARRCQNRWLRRTGPERCAVQSDGQQGFIVEGDGECMPRPIIQICPQCHLSAAIHAMAHQNLAIPDANPKVGVVEGLSSALPSFTAEKGFAVIEASVSWVCPEFSQKCEVSESCQIIYEGVDFNPVGRTVEHHRCVIQSGLREAQARHEEQEGKQSIHGSVLEAADGHAEPVADLADACGILIHVVVSGLIGKPL